MKLQDKRLKEMQYPGRGIVLGMTPDGKSAVQVYWTMGRSQNSKMRVFERQGDIVKTLPIGDAALVKPELIIYSAVMHWQGCHIVTNGRQTDDIYDGLKAGNTMEQSLRAWQYEDDGPIYTPRISGVTNVGEGGVSLQLSILKTDENDPSVCLRQFFQYDAATPGAGYCIHTYAANVNPCPPFTGEPFAVTLYDSIDETLDAYWDTLSPDFRVGLLVKFINCKTGKFEIALRNT